MEALVYLSGAFVVLTILGICFYLVKESRYAFERTFTLGYRFAAQSTVGEVDPVDFDPSASVLAVHTEGDEGLDAKEEVAPAPTLESLKGFQYLATAAVLGGDPAKANADTLYINDFRSPKRAEQGQKFALFAFATPEYTGKTMKLAWGPNEDADPYATPFRVRLRLAKAPEGVQVSPVDIDLSDRKSGSIELPTYIANTDDDRTKGYLFEVVLEPTTSNAMATLGGFFGKEWGPTLSQPRFGFLPLLASTLCITLIALLIASPISIAVAVFLSEIASKRLREILKPIIELLASIPTVVLAYFGLMLVAPAVQATVASALGGDSGRNMLTTAIVMGLLLVPTIATIAEDALAAAPGHLGDGR